MTTAWTPTTLAELESALESGLLVEGHKVDFKRELSTGSAGNKGFAKDVAAFAVDGGQILFGVDEVAGAPPQVRPIALHGLKERVDQIARSAVDPPVSVRCVELPVEGDPSNGCLVVIVPPSPQAPHQAAERLWGRSDTTNYVLSPGEIRRLYQRQASRRADLDRLLDDEIGRDPTPDTLREQAHLFVVAQPVGADSELFYGGLGEEQFSTWLHRNVHTFTPGNWQPDLPAGTTSRRARGWATHPHIISPERTVPSNGELEAKEGKLLDVEVQEDGGVRIFCARATDDRQDQRVMLDAVVGGLALRAVELAASVSATAGFHGYWDFGVALTNLHGAVSHQASHNILGNANGYSEDTYRKTTSASSAQITSPHDVADRLVAPLMRALRSPYTLPSGR